MSHEYGLPVIPGAKRPLSAFLSHFKVSALTVPEGSSALGGTDDGFAGVLVALTTTAGLLGAEPAAGVAPMEAAALVN
jgi:hypothetical protein